MVEVLMRSLSLSAGARSLSEERVVQIMGDYDLLHRPILINTVGQILDGVQTVEARKRLGFSTVVARIVCDGTTEDVYDATEEY